MPGAVRLAPNQHVGEQQLVVDLDGLQFIPAGRHQLGDCMGAVSGANLFKALVADALQDGYDFLLGGIGLRGWGLFWVCHMVAPGLVVSTQRSRADPHTEDQP